MHEILVTLGELKGGLDTLQSEFAEERRSASASRASVHRRLDEQATGMADLQTQVALSSAKVDDMADTHKRVVQPAVEDWRRMKGLGMGVAGLLALGGITVGGVLAWFGEAAVQAARHWLRIP